MEIKEAIELAKAGSEKAFTFLYNTYNRTIYNNIYNIVKNKDVADDILSETFLKAFKGIDKFTKDISFVMWLKTISNNQSIDFIRSGNKNKNDVYMDDENLTEIYHTDYSDPEKIYIKKESEEKFEEAVNSLTGSGGIVLKLRYLDNLSYQEIAKKTGLSIGTVKHYIFRYKQKISKSITNQQKSKKNEKKSILFNGNKVVS